MYEAQLGQNELNVQGAMKLVRHKEKLKKREYDLYRSLLANEMNQLSTLQKLGSNPYLPSVLQPYTTKDSWSFYVIERFEKGSVLDFIKSNASIRPACVFGIGWRLVKCLQLMHDAGSIGWLHLDVKPENVMIAR